MNAEPSEDARLEARLRSGAAELPDDGFSGRVLAALPRRRSSFAWRRRLLVAAGAASGFALALAAGASPAGLLAAAADDWDWASTQLADPWIAASAAVTLAILVFVWQDDGSEEGTF